MNLSRIKLDEIFRKNKETKNAIAPSIGRKEKSIMKGRAETRRGLIDAFNKNKSREYQHKDLKAMGYDWKKSKEFEDIVDGATAEK